MQPCILLSPSPTVTVGGEHLDPTEIPVFVWKYHSRTVVSGYMCRTVEPAPRPVDRSDGRKKRRLSSMGSNIR
jgi:hypothetical protein